MATVRPLRFLGVLLVLYAMVGWYVFSPAEVPADAVRVRLWLLFFGVVALIVDEVCERITQEAREVMEERAREGAEAELVAAGGDLAYEVDDHQQDHRAAEGDEKTQTAQGGLSGGIRTHQRRQ